MNKHDLPNPYGEYSGITKQNMKYEKCLDNYMEENFNFEFEGKEQV